MTYKRHQQLIRALSLQHKATSAEQQTGRPTHQHKHRYQHQRTLATCVLPEPPHPDRTKMPRARDVMALTAACCSAVSGCCGRSAKSGCMRATTRAPISSPVTGASARHRRRVLDKEALLHFVHFSRTQHVLSNIFCYEVAQTVLICQNASMLQLLQQGAMHIAC